MATLTFGDSATYVRFNPISSAINDLPTGAGTIAALVRPGGTITPDDIGGLNDNSTPPNGWYHILSISVTTRLCQDDDGTVMSVATSGATPTGATADDFFIIAVTFPAGIALEHFHFSSTMGAAESWTHVDSASNKAADRSGPGTNTGAVNIGYNNSAGGAMNGDIALFAIWSGVELSNANIEDLWISKKTSDWWNNPGGSPTMLVELTSTTPVDIGASPSTFSTIASSLLTGLDPTGWTFDGRGAVGPTPDISFLSAAGW